MLEGGRSAADTARKTLEVLAGNRDRKLRRETTSKLVLSGVNHAVFGRHMYFYVGATKYTLAATWT